MILEISKNYVKKFYSGDIKKAVAENDGVKWTQERIKAAFNFGNGTPEDLRRYMADNAAYSYFVTV